VGSPARAFDRPRRLRDERGHCSLACWPSALDQTLTVASLSALTETHVAGY
jgi:hypothetical protein